MEELRCLLWNRKGRSGRGGLDCLPPLISSHLAGQPWVALWVQPGPGGTGTRSQAQGSRGGRWPQRKGLPDRHPQEVGWHSPESSKDQGGLLGGEVPRGTHLGCPQ